VLQDSDLVHRLQLYSMKWEEVKEWRRFACLFATHQNNEFATHPGAPAGAARERGGGEAEREDMYVRIYCLVRVSLCACVGMHILSTCKGKQGLARGGKGIRGG